MYALGTGGGWYSEDEHTGSSVSIAAPISYYTLDGNCTASQVSSENAYLLNIGRNGRGGRDTS